MKVKELVSKLLELDQEKNIWLFYDFPWSVSEPEVGVVDETKVESNNSEYDIKVDDYHIGW